MNPSQPRPPINIAASTRKVDVDNRLPISKYYRTADNLLKQANIYREEKNIVDLYILLLRFSSLVGETIPEHNDYPTSSPQEKAEYRKKLRRVITELEKLKPEALREINRLNSIASSPQVNDRAVKNQFDWPNNSVTQVATSVTSNGLGHAYHVDERMHNLSISLPAPKVETLSRHSFLGQTGLRPRWEPPVFQTRVQYPTYIDTSPIEIPKLTDERKGSTLAEALTSSNDFDLELFKRGSGDFNVPPQTALIRQPSPPPVNALVQNLPISPYCTEPGGQIPPWKVADPFPGAPTTANGLKSRADGPKQLYISANMMNEFLRLASANTNRNLETCAVLAGALKNSSFYVNALIIPKQQSTSDSCQTLNEEEIFEWQDKRNLFQLGWIHTHPKQTCFMSSIDLHTHYSYQVMLPEAIAIVMAPTDTERKHGIFRLSDPHGIKLIQNCQQRGFHPHEQTEDGSSIYEHCGHVLMSSRLKYEVVDLR